MNVIQKVLLFILLLISPTSFSSNNPYTILISFDGFRWDYPNLGITPTFDFISTNGVSALSLQPCFPSKTFPNHYSIVTGMYPVNHGIFYAMGPSFRQDYKTGTVLNIDIYPLLCKILNIFPNQNIDGDINRIEFLLKENTDEIIKH